MGKAKFYLIKPFIVYRVFWNDLEKCWAKKDPLCHKCYLVFTEFFFRFHGSFARVIFFSIFFLATILGPPSNDKSRGRLSLSLSFIHLFSFVIFIYFWNIFIGALDFVLDLGPAPSASPFFFKQKNFEPPQGVGASPYPKRKFTKKKQKKNKKIRLMKTLFEITIATRSNRNPLRSNYEQDLLSDRQKLETQQQNPVNSVKLSETRGHLW